MTQKKFKKLLERQYEKLVILQGEAYELERANQGLYDEGVNSLEGQLNDSTNAISEAIRIVEFNLSKK